MVEECPEGYDQRGELNFMHLSAGNQIMDGIYNDCPDIKTCQAYCDARSDCMSFAYGGPNISKNYNCYLYNAREPNGSYGTNFRFCRKRECKKFFPSPPVSGSPFLKVIHNPRGVALLSI